LLTPHLRSQLLYIVNGRPQWSDSPVIVLEANGGMTMEEYRPLAALAGHCNVLPVARPINPVMLILAAKSALRSARRQQQVGDLLSQHNQILTSIQDAFATLDAAWRFTYVNDHACRLCGMSPVQMLGRAIWELFPSIHGTELESNLRRVMVERVSVDFEWLNRLWDRWFAIRIYPSESGIAFFAIEITAQKKIESVLEESERRLHLALDTSYLGTWYCDLPFDKVIWDVNCKRHFGIKPEEEVSMDRFYTLLHPEDRLRTREAIERSISDRSTYDIVYRAVHEDGSHRWIHAIGRAFYRPDGQPFRFDGITIDITDRKQAEIELLRARQEAIEANQAKDHFLAALSHELRTPLTPVLMTVAAMRQDPALPPLFQRDLGLIYRNVELEARLIDDLLDLTRVTRGKLVLHQEVADVHELLEHTIHMCCEPDVVPKTLVITYQAGARNHHVCCDPARVQQVFWNLINNAIKFTPENGSIAIETRNRAPDRIEVTVTDSGIGIDADVLPRLFDAFEQGGTAITRKFGGLGLGLAISKAITEMHGGVLSAASEGRDRGAAFTLDLATCVARATPDLVALPNSSGRARHLKILLAEDHEPTRNVLTRLLARAGHEVRAAATVAQALKFAEDGHFDLLVSDLGLPDSTGSELMRQLRATRGMRGIALSGYGMEEDIKASLEAGFAIHLTKPVDWNRLEAAVNRLMADTA